QARGRCTKGHQSTRMIPMGRGATRASQIEMAFHDFERSEASPIDEPPEDISRPRQEGLSFNEVLFGNDARQAADCPGAELFISYLTEPRQRSPIGLDRLLPPPLHLHDLSRHELNPSDTAAIADRSKSRFGSRIQLLRVADGGSLVREVRRALKCLRL